MEISGNPAIAGAAAHPGFQHPDIVAGSSSRSASRLRRGARSALGSGSPSRRARAAMSCAAAAGVLALRVSGGKMARTSCTWAWARAELY